MTTLRIVAALLALAAAGSSGAQSQCEIPDFLQTLHPDGLDPNARFGTSLAVHGDLAVVGAVYQFDTAGAVFVYRHVGSAWIPEDVLTAPVQQLGANFGRGVATDGAIIVVGSPGERCEDHPEDPLCAGGAAYIYRHDGSGWSLEERLVDGATHDPPEFVKFGWAVAVLDDLVAVGAPNDLAGFGRVYVYRHDGSSWELETNIAQGGVGGQHGSAVALVHPDGADVPHLVVGAPYYEGVWVRDSDNWGVLAFWPSPFGSESRWGRSVAAQGSRIVVGAHWSDVAQMTHTGAARAYVYAGASWGIDADLVASDAEPFDEFGFSVAVNGDRIMVGAPREDGKNPQAAGAAYYFADHGSGWQEVAKLADPEPNHQDRFGFSVGLSPLAIVAGVENDYHDEGNPPLGLGSVMMFTRDRDTDEDGLLDCWETEGIDVDGDGTIDLDLPALGANPMRKDVFIEVDAMTDLGPTVIADPPQAVIDAGLATGTSLDHVIQSFLDAPVGNPDATTGINLHIEYDEIDIPPALWPGPWNEFDGAKGDHFGSPSQRQDANAENVLEAKRMSHRYCIFARGILGDQTSGMGEIPGNDFMVSLGLWNTPGGTVDEQAGTFMHELGHTLGLDHGGGDGHNYKQNYYSVMNYLWQTPEAWQFDWRLDYSRDALPTLDEASLVECDGISAPSGPIYDFVLVPYNVELLFTNPPDIRWALMTDTTVDWDVDMSGCETVARDINRVSSDSDGLLTELNGHDDWSSLLYDFRETAGYADGVHPVPSDAEMTLELREELDALPPPPALCVADLDGDGVVGFPDLLAVLSAWNTPDADVTGDGVTDFADLLEVLSTWGPC